MLNITNILKISKPTMFFIAGLLLFILVGIGIVNGANLTATQNGNWSAIATWGGSSVPTSADAVFIPNGFTVTVDITTAVCASIQAGVKNNGAGTLAFNSGSILIVSGDVTLGASTGNGIPSGSIQMTNGGLFKIGGALTAPYLGTWTPGTGTIEYNSVIAQTVYANTYNNLTLSGSGSKTTTGVTVNNVLSMEGTATASIAPTYGAAATLQYNTATVRTAGVEWITPFAATGGVVIANTGAITLNSAEVFNTSVPLTINNGAILVTNNNQLTFGGDFHNGGTFTSGSSAIVIAGTAAIQSIDGFTTTGTVSMTKTAGTATFQGNVNGAGLIINGTGGTLNLGTGFTHTFTGDVTLTAGTLNGGSSTLVASNNWTNNGGTFTSGTGTVTINGAAKIIGGTSSTIFNNLTINNASGSLLGISQTVNGTLTLTSGRLTLGVCNLTLGVSSPAVAGILSANNMIVTNSTGELRKNFSANGSYVFPVGEVTGTAEYSPITINFASGTYAAGAYASARVINSKHPNNTSITNYLNRYWTLGQTGITSFSSTVTGSYVAADIAGTESSQVAGKYSGSLPWTKYSTLSANTLTASGVTSFGDFTGINNIPTISTSITTLTGFSYIFGSGPSSEQSFTVSGTELIANLTVTPPTDYEISLTSGGSFVATNPMSLTPTSGTVVATTIYVRLKAGLAIGNYAAENVAMTSTNAITKNVACSGTVTDIPVITISPTILTEFSYLIGAGPSSQQSFTVSGVNLIGNITVTPPAHYEISLTSGVSFAATNPISFTPTGKTVATTTIFVRLKAGLAGGIYAGENIASASTSATTQNVACSGIVNAYVQIWNGGAYQASYPTLKAAFDAINLGTFTGALEIRINGNIAETATAALYQSGYTGGGGTSNYSSVNIYPTIAGITVTGNLAAPLIDLNGADNVTIDGSVNALSSTKTLTITNTSTSNIVGTSTIRFINSAENNAIKYCTIKGSETSATSGVVVFSTATAGNGNNGNTIDNNDITSNAVGSRPINAIYSAGTALRENSINTILNNNIFDFWNAGASSSAIQLAANTSDFIISRNSFYETTSLIPTGAFSYKMIWINNPTGNNFTVSNNYLGGTAPLNGGSALLLGTTGTVQLVTLDPIEISAGTTMASSIQGNTIQNISFRSSNAAPFRAINAVAGALNIGTESGNILGSDSGNGSITVTSTIATGNVYGIYIASSNTVDCQNNSIGSITTANTSAVNATNLFGIYKTATTGTTTISKNTIGSTTTANSLNTSSTATASSQLLYGIYSAGTGNTTISTNIVANITNSTTETTLASRLRGILTEGGSNDINNNDVHHLLSRGAANGANYPNTSLIGISQVSKLAGSSQNVSGNSVYNLTNTATVKMEMYGIYYDGPSTGTNTISRNFVHTFNISSTDAAYLHGISLYGGAFTASNNIVYLGNTITTGCSMWAMWTNSTNSIRIYHNTLYLGGTAASGASNTYAFRSLNAGPTDAIIKNNILWNNRTNSSNVISHYAIYLQSSANTSVDYNDFRFYQQFGIVGATTYASFATWKTGTGFDTNSTEADPLLINLGGALPTDYQTSVPLDGVPGTGILTDYNNIVRSTIAPTMGAWEYFSNPVEVWNGTTFRKGYTTLKGAFDKINDGIWTGDLIIKFKGNTIETAPAVLNASGTGLSSYTKILIYPSRLGVTVTGSLAEPLVDLNGCDNVTFDGRKDATGTASEITFSNTSTSNVAGTSTFRFINDATNNTIKYCAIKGASTDAAAGIVFFSSTTGTTGNDGNTIDINMITNSADANRPVNAIYSLGTSAKENSGNTISNNNIYNFLNRGTASNGIQLADFNTTWTIVGNSFYETASFAPSVSVIYNAIYINNTSGTGSGFTVSGNYIGGNAALSGGSAWTKTAAFDNGFTAINMNVGNGVASNVQNNTIQNFAWSNSLNSAWTGINIAAGSINIGTSIANIIGAATGTNSITITNTTTGANVYGINIASVGTIDCQNNIIGSITTANVAANATNLYGIKTSTSGISTISNNTIGSTSVANSINASSLSSGNAQSTYGIYNDGSGTISITGNTIANLKNATTNTIATTLGLINGIASTNGTNIITGNIIRNLTIANANNSATNSAAVCGIALTGASLKTVTGNTIYGLSNIYASFAGSVIGLNFGGNTGANIVTRNFIHSLTVASGSTAGSLFGIKIASGATTYSNNIISLDGNTATTIFGIYETGASGNDNNLYFNTVYVFGSLGTGITNKSYCLYSVGTTNSRNFRNNIFSNARTTAGGASLHYAIYFNYDIPTNLTLNNNDYYAPGVGGVLGYYGAANKTVLPIVSSIDANSQIINPVFVLAGSTVATDYKIGVTLTGATGIGITIDYGSNSRGSIPTMGAWEGNINKWKGSSSTDWNTASNWTGNVVPTVDASIFFDDLPMRHCLLDQDRSVTNITNAQGVYRMVTNGHKLTVKGNFNFTNGAQIDASYTNSNVVIAGVSAQTIPIGAFFNNEVYDLTVNNANNVTLFGTLRLLHLITAVAGRLDANTNFPVVVYAGTAAQTIEKDRYLTDNIYDLTIDNVSGVALASTAAINVPHDLTITTGVLTVPPGATLTVDNYTHLDYRATVQVLSVDYWSCLVLKSNATSTGSFIHTDLFTGIGTVKVERFMSKSNNWHLCSSPIKDQSVKDFLKYNPEIPDLYNTAVTPNVIIGVGIRDYSTVTDIWNPYIIYANANTTAGSIGKGKGFSIRTIRDYLGIPGTSTVDATGIPNLNNVSVVLTRSGATTDNGWSCIGNPFTSAININDATSNGFLNATNIANLDPSYVSVYVWDTNNITTTHTTPEYIVINNATSLSSVQVSQGFFVKSKTGGGSVSFTKGMQTPNAALTFKAAATEWPSLKIVAKNQTLSSSTEIKFVINTTKGLDPGYDAGMLKANPEFSLYSKLLEDNAIDFTLQCLPDQNYDQYVIPIGIDSKAGGVITFTAETVNLPSGCKAVLEDRLLNRFTRLDLKGANYMVALNPNTKGSGRFFLHTAEVDSPFQPLEKQSFSVYAIGKIVYINGNISENARFFLYSVNGKLLASSNAENQVQNTMDASGFPGGVYLLTLIDNGQKKSVKFVLEN